MARIIYLCPFSPNEISGGIKTAYQHAELLTELGYDAFVWQLGGRPTWLHSKARTIEEFPPEAIRPTDTLVFPETLHVSPLPRFFAGGQTCTKLVFCQNQNYIFNEWIPSHTYSSLGFRDVFCSSQAAKRCLEDLLGMKNIAVVPYYVDSSKFRPSPVKNLQIAMAIRKLPGQASFITAAFWAKYPDARDVPLAVIDNHPEDQVADILGHSTVLLSLSCRESFGLVPIEAMAAGCLVAGYHGHGGLEYAKQHNGFWFGLDEAEKVVHALYHCVKGIRSDAPWTRAMRRAGEQTANRYNRDATKQALSRYLSGLGIVP
jgi:hypothetical protein